MTDLGPFTEALDCPVYAVTAEAGGERAGTRDSGSWPCPTGSGSRRATRWTDRADPPDRS